MMRRTLKRHPDTPCDAVTSIAVDIARTQAGVLELSYLVAGDTGGMRWPPLAAPARTDGLWQRTCFEAFIRAAHQPGYREFNFAPSTQWAAYEFTGYRENMANADATNAPVIATQATAGGYLLTAKLEFGAPPPWHLALSAVIEETNGRKSYWALAHPPGKPDFHHSDSFAFELK